jgi:hypothetical protein
MLLAVYKYSIRKKLTVTGFTHQGLDGKYARERLATPETRAIPFNTAP